MCALRSGRKTANNSSNILQMQRLARSLFLKSVKSNSVGATAASTREKRVNHPILDGGLSSKRPAV
jgi:hypothetical protein